VDSFPDTSPIDLEFCFSWSSSSCSSFCFFLRFTLCRQIPGGILPRAVRHSAHGGLAGAVGGNGQRSRSEDRAPAQIYLGYDKRDYAPMDYYGRYELLWSHQDSSLNVTVANDLALAINADGTYTYSGGTLSVGGNITTGSGTSTLNIDADTTEALEALAHSLELAEPEGYIRIFIDLQEPMAQLLSLAIQKGIYPEYARQLMATFPSSTTLPGALFNIERNNLALVEPLSQRELEVLRLLETELSGPEIAHELVISLSTVRTHTKSIYSKLNANNRRAAVKRAEELHLI
jgi:DNA-binding CsgD family transcriptional regulator